MIGRPNGSLLGNIVSPTSGSMKGKEQVKAVGLRGEKYIDDFDKERVTFLKHHEKVQNN